MSAISRSFRPRTVAVALGREIDVAEDVAAVRRGHERFRAVLHPLHRDAEALGDRGRDVLFAVDVDLGAEAAAHLGRDGADLILAEAGHRGDERLEDVRVLGRRPDGHRLLARLEVRDHASPFHRAWRETLVHHPLRDDDLGLGECGIDRGVVHLSGRAHAGAARHQRDGQVVRERRVNDGRLPGHGELEIHDRRQRVIRHDDRVCGIASDVAIGRDHDRDRLAAVADRVDRDRAVIRRRERRPDRHRRQELGDLRAGEDGFDARPWPSRRWCRSNGCVRARRRCA